MHPAFSPLVIKNVAIKAVNPIRRITVPPTLVEKESQLNLPQSFFAKCEKYHRPVVTPSPALQVTCPKTMSFDQIVGDAAECPCSPFANPGRNRVPKTVDNGTPNWTSEEWRISWGRSVP
jgi:hypothetical protein